MQKTQEDMNPNEEMNLDGFTDYEEELESVQDINQGMMEARGEWNPPEKPDYNSSIDGNSSYYEGTVRSIDMDDVRYEDYRMIRVGLDVGESELKWVSVKDTGEMSIDNPFVQFCRMYDADPESVQDLYGQKIHVNSKYDNPVVSPSTPIVKHLWLLHHIQHKNDFYRYKKKKYMDGLVPNFRHTLFYGAVAALSMYLISLGASLMVFPVFFISMIVLSWSVYAKMRYDVGPYLGKMAMYYWDVYSHKKA